jgi:endonuclease G, mitochondrial
MSFTGYLSPNEINDLMDKAVDSGLVLANPAILLQGIYKPFALGLPNNEPNVVDRFNLYLVRLNETERLADGQVPLVQFLQNSANYLRRQGQLAAEDFERVASAIGNRTEGVKPLPDPKQLREVQTKEAIVGVNDMVDFSFLAAGIEVGASVGRVVVPRFEYGKAIQTSPSVPWTMLGTAWLIGPSLMLTNHHVINARLNDEASASAADFDTQGQNTIVEFDFDTSNSVRKSITVDRVVASSTDLDYAVLHLKADPGRPPLSLNPERVIFGAASYIPVNIVQHPRGLPKRVAFRNNLLTGADNEVIRYFTDTDFGSSGSPVCDDAWRVVALHRGATYVSGVTYQGKSTAYVNFGSQIQAVLEDVKRQDATVYNQITADQMKP